MTKVKVTCWNCDGTGRAYCWVDKDPYEGYKRLSKKTCEICGGCGKVEETPKKVKPATAEIIRILDDPWEEGEDVIILAMTPTGAEEFYLNSWEEYYEVADYLAKYPSNYILELDDA